jgi:hypothetical protein
MEYIYGYMNECIYGCICNIYVLGYMNECNKCNEYNE